MDDAEAPPLAEQLCFDLYAASRAVTHAYRPALSELGLTYPQYLVMIVLWERGPCTVRELGHELMLDHGTLTPLLRRMESNGVLARHRQRLDERFVEISLTPSGDALRIHASRIQCDMKAAMGLDAGEFESLQAVLQLLTSRLTRDPEAITEV